MHNATGQVWRYTLQARRADDTPGPYGPQEVRRMRKARPSGVVGSHVEASRIPARVTPVLSSGLARQGRRAGMMCSAADRGARRAFPIDRVGTWGLRSQIRRLLGRSIFTSRSCRGTRRGWMRPVPLSSRSTASWSASVQRSQRRLPSSMPLESAPVAEEVAGDAGAVAAGSGPVQGLAGKKPCGRSWGTARGCAWPVRSRYGRSARRSTRRPWLPVGRSVCSRGRASARIARGCCRRSS